MQEEKPAGADKRQQANPSSPHPLHAPTPSPPLHWGVKTAWMAANPEERAAWHRLFPGSRWIVCLRDPVATYRSLRQTFCPEMNPEEFSRRWHEVRLFLQQEPQRCWHFDLEQWRKATPEKRRAWMEEVLAWLGLEPEKAVLDAAVRFPRVNEALPPGKRPHVSELDLERVRQLCG